MQLVAFVLIYPLLWLISILPESIFYKFSDFVYFFVYRVFGYRKKTVRENLALTLTHLSEKERLEVEKKFFSHMCDMFLEMIKTMSISEKEIFERFKLTNLEEFQKLEKQNKSIVLICAHYASYEWIISMNKHINFKGYGIYKKINNPYFDKLVRKIRSRFKAILITTKETKSTIQENFKNNTLSVYGFASDQSPQIQSSNHWNTFMGIEVPVHVGAEKLAKQYDMNVIFLRTKKVKRGYYEASFEIMTENPRSIPNYEITDRFLKLVEKQIHEAPEFYFWTHKRWKHADKNPKLKTNF